jgi:hypothetical protein
MASFEWLVRNGDLHYNSFSSREGAYEYVAGVPACMECDKPFDLGDERVVIEALPAPGVKLPWLYVQVTHAGKCARHMARRIGENRGF